MLNGIGNVELVGSIKIGSTEYTADQLASEISNSANINADNFTSIGKNTIIDNTFELDWENAIDVPALSTFYQADKSGIVWIRAIDGSFGVYCSPQVYEGAAGNRPIFGNSVTTTRSGAASTLVIKGNYYLIESDASSIYEKKFIPFKNSISSNNN